VERYHFTATRRWHETLVRMAQWSSPTGIPLVDGSGNFGSLDGDPAAAVHLQDTAFGPP